MNKVKFCVDCSEEIFKKSTLVPDWINRISKEVDLVEARIIGLDLFPGPRIGFVEIDADYIFENKKYNEHFFLLGRSVYIIVLYKTENNEFYTILVQQPRIGSGKSILEYPAGMVDDSRDYRGAAIRELEEECGIIAKEEELIEVTDFVFTSAYVSDDNAKVFMVIRNETLDNLKKKEGSCFGADEDEVITLKVVKLNEVENITNDSVTIYSTMKLKEEIEKGNIIL